MKYFLLFIFLVSKTYSMSNGDTFNDFENHGYLVSIRINIDNKLPHLCGGAILNKNTILTAGHCLSSEKSLLGKIKIYSGHQQLSKQKEIAEVKEYFVHDLYEEFIPYFTIFDNEVVTYRFAVENDLAIIKTSDIDLTANGNNSISLINSANDDLFQTISTRGWGNYDDEKKENHTAKQMGFLKTHYPEELSNLEDHELMSMSKLLRATHPIGKTYSMTRFFERSDLFLFYSPKKDQVVCSGDSGSPIVRTIQGKGIELIGVVSATADFRCGNHRTNSAFGVDLQKHLSWIEVFL